MTESDPRVEGFMRAISAYFGIEYSELQSLFNAADHTGAVGDGLSRPGTDTTLASREPTCLPVTGG